MGLAHGSMPFYLIQLSTLICINLKHRLRLPYGTQHSAVTPCDVPSSLPGLPAGNQAVPTTLSSSPIRGRSPQRRGSPPRPECSSGSHSQWSWVDRPSSTAHSSLSYRDRPRHHLRRWGCHAQIHLSLELSASRFARCHCWYCP